MATKFATPINLLQNAIQNGVFQSLSSAPTSPAPVNGQFYYDTTLTAVGFYQNSAWVYVSVATANAVTQATASSATGIVLLSAGANRTAQAYSPSGAGLVKVTSSGVASIAVSATDFAPATTGTSILKASSGGFANAVVGTDYAAATPGTVEALASNGSGGFQAATLTNVAAPTANWNIGGTYTVTGLPTPVNPSDTAPKSYVDGVVQGISAKYSAVAATTGSETYTITSGNVTQISGTAVDGVSPNVNDYVLVMSAPAVSGAGTANSSSGVGSLEPGNGLYLVTSNTTNLSLSRALDMAGTNIPTGAYVYIAGGTANGKAGFAVTTPSTSAAFTYGTGNIQFTQFNGAGEIAVGTGLTKSGNTLSINASTVLQKYTSGSIGDGSSTTLTVTHNLNNQYPAAVAVYDTSGSHPQEMQCDVICTSVNALTLTFGTAPAASSIVCAVAG